MFGLNVIISEFFVNIGAAWFGVVFIDMKLIKESTETRLLSLTGNISCAILSLLIAYLLRFKL